MFTADDERNLALYLAVLKAKADGHSDLEIASTLFGINVICQPEKAQAMVAACHRRALQLTDRANLREIASPLAATAPSDPISSD